MVIKGTNINDKQWFHIIISNHFNISAATPPDKLKEKPQGKRPKGAKSSLVFAKGNVNHVPVESVTDNAKG